MFGRARSKAELQQLKNEYLANLQVEIDNASTIEKRKFKADPAPPVPPQYKTEEELRGEVRQVENELVQQIMNDIGYGYSKAVETIQKFTTDEKIKLLALYPQFKATIAKDAVKSKLRLLDPAFINLRMKQFLNSTDKSFGASNLAGIPASVEDLTEMMPTPVEVRELLAILSQPELKFAMEKSGGAENLKLIYNYINRYIKVYPSIQDVMAMKTRLPYVAKTALVRTLGELIVQYNMLTKQDITDIITFINENIVSAPQNIAGFVMDKLGGADVKNLDYFETNWKETLLSNGGTNLPPTQDIDELKDLVYEPSITSSVSPFPFLGEDTSRTKKVRRPKDETSSLAQSSLSTELSGLFGLFDDEDIMRIANEIDDYLTRIPAKRKIQILEGIVKPIQFRVIEDFGFTDVGDLDDIDEGLKKEMGSQIVLKIKEAIDKDAEENVGMTIEEIDNEADVDALDFAFDEYRRQDEDAFADLLETAKREYSKTPTQRQLENQARRGREAEQARVGRRETRGMMGEDINVAEQISVLQPSRGQVISDVFEGLDIIQNQENLQALAEQEGRDVEEITDNIIIEVSNRIKALIAKAKNFANLQAIYDELYTMANLNFNANLPFPKRLNPAIDTKKGIESKILQEIVIPIIRANPANLPNPYDPDEYKLFNPKSYPEIEGIDELVGFGSMRKGFHKMPDGKIMKNSEHMKGRGKKPMKSTPSVSGRISVKKLIGKGIDVEKQPTYKQFGKYVMHYPHLMNNVFNVKYPSLGSIPSIKPKTISDEYKEFVADIFETGKPNERLFNNLDDEEKSHFLKVVKGAGLMETFKLRRGETDEEKEDLDRFNLLKGSFVAGNNSESVVRELRSLITKFIHEGRITKNEGLQMLMEIK